jgi:hypothetical protein
MHKRNIFFPIILLGLVLDPWKVEASVNGLPGDQVREADRPKL